MNLFVPSVYSTVMLSLPSTQAVGGQHREGGIPQLAGHKPQRTPCPPRLRLSTSRFPVLPSE